FRYIDFRYRILRGLQERLQMGSFWKNEPILRGFMAGLDTARRKTNPKSGIAEVQMKSCGQVKCAVGRESPLGTTFLSPGRPAHNMGTRGHPGWNSLEVASGSAYAPGSSLRRIYVSTRRCR